MDASDALIERITGEVLRRLADSPAGIPDATASAGAAGATLSGGGRMPLVLFEPNTFKVTKSAGRAAGAGHTPGPVVDCGTLDVCLPCSGCGGCVTRRPKTVKEMIACGAARITSTSGWLPIDDGFASIIDHTILKPDATLAEINTLCAEAAEYGFATVCVNPTWVRHCAEKLRGTRVKVCTVVGFPLGAALPEVKAYETSRAIRDGAGEIDMVINIGALKSGDLKLVGFALR